MTTVLIFAVVLLAAVLLSELAHRTVVSTAVLFLAAGYVCGNGVLGWIDVNAGDPVVSRLAELALVAILFTDGMKVGFRELLSAWRLPGRALLLGLPLTLALNAVFCRYIAGLDWLQAFLVGAVLSPTDPVFASAVIGRKHIPPRVRHLLNVESGVNDGLALPLVLTFLALAGAREIGPGKLVLELAGGIAIGIAVPWVATRLERIRWFSISDEYKPLFALSIGILVWAGAANTNANEFLAAFAAGITIASCHSTLRNEFKRFGELVSELFKLSALLLFGALMSSSFWMESGWQGWVLAILILVAARPIALIPSLWRSELRPQEKLVVSWFGPKGFASVLYAIMVLKSDLTDAQRLFHLMALVIVFSMVAHSTTDVPIARWFKPQNAAA